MTRRSPNKNNRKRFKKGKNDGRYRSTDPKDQRSADRKPSDAGGDDTVGTLSYKGVPIRTFTTIDPTNIRPGGVTYVGKSPVQQALIDFNDIVQQPQIIRTFIYGDDLAKPNRPDLKREMKLGEITAYRCWRLCDGLLRSVYMKDIWYPNTPHVGRDIDDWGERGIHGWKEPNSEAFSDYVRGYLQDHLGSPWSTYEITTLITGSVFLWGDVVEHTYGYRAEFAKVRSLDWVYPIAADMGNEAGILNQLRRKYNV